MAPHKFHALGDRIMHRRLEHLKSIELPQRGEDLDSSSLKLREEEEGGTQLRLAFQRQSRLLDVFHKLDSQTREVEWSYYGRSGEFLLHFALDLKNRAYQVFSIHPCLLSEGGEMKPYLDAINNHLRGHYPPLELAVDKLQGPIVQRLE
jgi:hypothetical protein